MMRRPERRQSSRIRIFGDLHGRVVQADTLVVLRDISAGGFAIESPQLFQPGADLTVELTAPTGTTFVATATVRQCVRQLDSEDSLPFLVSFVFSEKVERAPGAIEAFVAQFDFVQVEPNLTPNAYKF